MNKPENNLGEDILDISIKPSNEIILEVEKVKTDFNNILPKKLTEEPKGEKELIKEKDFNNILPKKLTEEPKGENYLTQRELDSAQDDIEKQIDELSGIKGETMVTNDDNNEEMDLLFETFKRDE